ncbi:hypothetical protein A8926_6188 [Saccharopolyspora spinosa]|uniref:Uncharacterized protein n=1 Tax=Saccharopolyspora spinosa TaxID=60894 RepID=A0A2N3Y5D7_SACSN|nr:hypothetical protein A8926_6188 [Saccharopolyspora spinosa]
MRRMVWKTWPFAFSRCYRAHSRFPGGEYIPALKGATTMDLSTAPLLTAEPRQRVDSDHEPVELASPGCLKQTVTPAVAMFDESHIVRGYD